MLPNPPVINDQILGPANGQLADGQTNGQSNGQPDNETNGHHSNGDNGPGAGPDVTSQLVVDDNNDYWQELSYNGYYHSLQRDGRDYYNYGRRNQRPCRAIANHPRCAKEIWKVYL